MDRLHAAFRMVIRCNNIVYAALIIADCWEEFHQHFVSEASDGISARKSNNRDMKNFTHVGIVKGIKIEFQTQCLLFLLD